MDLCADNKSEVTISAIPVNALGYKAFMREAEAVYKITEGQKLVEIIINDNTKGILKIRARKRSGLVKITAESPYSLLPSPITIEIYPYTVEVKHEVNGII